MINKLKGLMDKEFFHICIVIIIIVTLLFISGFIVLRYNVEGETNMPFNISKIAIISTAEGIDKPSEGSKWAFDIFQCNDIYIYIDKNKEYKKTELIKSIVIDDIQIEGKNKENIKIYKPEEKEEKVIFKNNEDNQVTILEYIGDNETNLKGQQISNQGGILAFRCSNNNLAEYKSDEEEISHYQLLKKANILEEDLNFKIYFNVTLKLESGKEYKTEISLDLPVENIIEDGTASTEITDLSKLIFKRVKNN